MTEQTLHAVAEEVTQIINRAAATVVQIQPQGRRPTSATVCGPDQLLAIDHTLASAERLQVKVDDRTAEAKVVGRDEINDLALVSVAGLAIQALPVRSEAPRIGELAAIVGRDRQGRVSASFGIIGSVTGPTRFRRGVIEQLIRIDASPFAGISGAAIVDTEGRLLGLANGALVRGTSLAIPASTALSIAKSLAEHGRIKRGYLGIASQPVHLSTAYRQGHDQSQGLLVVNVGESSPAERSGLLLGDVILSFDGHRVEVPDDLLDLLTAERIDRRVAVSLIRSGKQMTVDVTVGERRAR